MRNETPTQNIVILILVGLLVVAHYYGLLVPVLWLIKRVSPF